MNTLALAIPIAAGAAALAVVAVDASVTLPAGEAAVVAPMMLVDGALHQPGRTELPEGGRATFTFSLAEPGDYEIRAEVNAPGGGSNSCYLNIDAPPDGPGMIWDMDVTDGFAESVVSWRGKGSLDEPEFQVKVFTLAAGEHTLVLVGREPARLRALTIQRHVPVEPGSLPDLKSRYTAAERAYRHKTGFLDDSPESEKAAMQHWRVFDDTVEALFRQAVDRAARETTAASEGFELLEWVLLIPRSHYQPVGSAALKSLRQRHVADPRIGRVVAMILHLLPDPEEPHHEAVVDLLHGVAELNPDHTVRGQAVMGLALLDNASFERAEAGGDAAEVAAAREVVEAALERVVRDHDACADLRFFPRRPERTQGARARSELHEIRDLGIGWIAPEIDTVDIEGGRMTLGEHRGRAVMLVFWASWCGPCMAAVPHEKELVARFQGRPFVMLGVNGDESPDAAVRAVRRHEIPWRSFWNGGDEGRTVAQAWNVRGWPTIYLIDHRGIIRDKYARGGALDVRLEELVTHAEQER